jgi:hypothetical protein
VSEKQQDKNRHSWLLYSTVPYRTCFGSNWPRLEKASRESNRSVDNKKIPPCAAVSCFNLLDHPLYIRYCLPYLFPNDPFHLNDTFDITLLRMAATVLSPAQ